MLPETLVIDNGPASIGEGLKDLCGQLGINLEWNPTVRPRLKGKLERLFTTHNTGVIHGLPGASFSNEEGEDNSAE
jgi:putative transposase